MPDRSSVGDGARLEPASADPSEATRWPPLETLHSSLIGIAATFMSLAPRFLPVLLTTIAVVSVIETLRAGRTPRQVVADVFAPLAMRFGLAFFVFGALSALWSGDRALALTSVTQISLLVLATGANIILLPPLLARLPARRANRFVRALPLGLALGLAYLLVEFATGNAVSLAVVSRFPSLVESAKEVERQGGRIVGFLPFFLDRNVAAMTLLVPAGLVAARAWLPEPAGQWAGWALLAAAALAITVSWSGAAKLAGMAGAAAAFAVFRWQARAIHALMALLIAGVVLALPLGHLPSRMGMETAGWLPPSFRERAMIWDRTASAVRRNFLFGVGAQQTRYQDGDQRVRVEGVIGERRPLGWHAHNVVLQTWLELGAVGALLLLGLGLASLRAIAAMPSRRQPAAAAVFAMVLAIGVTGWGIWQPWLAAIVGMAAVGLWLPRPATD